jgi:DNA-binding MarR family transcriptional regulator
MSQPSAEATAAWARLVRVQQALLAGVEADLKAAGFPPLAWYDALLELSRVPDGKLRPIDLGRAMLLPQYGMSRLLERMTRAGLVRREACPGDGRGQLIAITPEGGALRAQMWDVYAAAIERRVGTKLTGQEARQLDGLLCKLVQCPTAALGSQCRSGDVAMAPRDDAP